MASSLNFDASDFNFAAGTATAHGVNTDNAANTAANANANPETDRAAAQILHVTAQLMQVDGKHRKELLRRRLTRLDKLEAENEERKADNAPHRKRAREYLDAKLELDHADRMVKLKEKHDNDNRTRR